MRLGGIAVTAVAAMLVAQTCLAKTLDEAVLEQLKAFVDSGEIPGAVALVASSDGELLGTTTTVTWGKADLASGRPMQPDTLFGIMSMTKPITATALMTLVDEGKVSLDDPVEEYIPAFVNAKTNSGKPVKGLTVRRLLTHTSGLTGDQGCEVSLEATANALAERPFAFQPGEKWEYGPSINVIGRIIEVAAGKPYEEVLAERIFRPLGMADTTFHPQGSQQDRLATLYKKDGDKLVPGERWHGAGEPGCVPNPSGGLFSTAGDMAKFYRAVLNGGELDGQRIVSADAVRQMTTVQYPDLETGFTPGNRWGLGWCIVREPQGVTSMLSPGTFGHGGAYGTQGWVDPVAKRIFVLLYQRQDIGNSDGSPMRGDFQQAAVSALEH